MLIISNLRLKSDWLREINYWNNYAQNCGSEGGRTLRVSNMNIIF